MHYRAWPGLPRAQREGIPWALKLLPRRWEASGHLLRASSYPGPGNARVKVLAIQWTGQKRQKQNTQKTAIPAVIEPSPIKVA